MERRTQAILAIGITLLAIVGLIALAWSMSRDNETEMSNNTQNMESNELNEAAENEVTNEDSGTASTQANTTSNTPSNSTSEESIPQEEVALAEPTPEFQSRITKKRFGTYVTPSNSPVQPERFTGYHNAVDVEYDDVANDVPVFAVADGEIVSARTADGYGGVFAMTFSHEGKQYVALYGHIRPSTLPKVGTAVKKGGRVGVLGTGFTSETDNERKHLHFAVRPGTSVDIRGYVSSESQLSGWIDPLSLY